MFCGDITYLSYGLKFGSFINNIEDRVSINVHNINKDGMVKIRVLVFL